MIPCRFAIGNFATEQAGAEPLEHHLRELNLRRHERLSDPDDGRPTQRGLRVPSEPLGLRWADVDWERTRITVGSPKTEHIEGGESSTDSHFP